MTTVYEPIPIPVKQYDISYQQTPQKMTVEIVEQPNNHQITNLNLYDKVCLSAFLILILSIIFALICYILGNDYPKLRFLIKIEEIIVTFCVVLFIIMVISIIIYSLYKIWVF